MDREFIYNCATDKSDRELLMVRTKILKTPFGNLDLHVFHASDAGRDLHDHPWAYISLILRGGYCEVTPDSKTQRAIINGIPMPVPDGGWTRRRRRRPYSLAYRAARFAHRVELIDGTPSVSLVWTFPKYREWGFFTHRGWQCWRDYHDAKGCL
jgi:hypothetical protein